MSKAICRVYEVKRPYGGQFIGWRLQAAVPNDSGGMFAKKDSNGWRTSFHKKFLVRQTSDMSDYPPASMIRAFERGLRKRGKWTSFEWLTGPLSKDWEGEEEDGDQVQALSA